MIVGKRFLAGKNWSFIWLLSLKGPEIILMCIYLGEGLRFEGQWGGGGRALSLFISTLPACAGRKPAWFWRQGDLLSESGIELVSEELVEVMMLMEGLIP